MVSFEALFTRSMAAASTSHVFGAPSFFESQQSKSKGSNWVINSFCFAPNIASKDGNPRTNHYGNRSNTGKISKIKEGIVSGNPKFIPIRAIPSKFIKRISKFDVPKKHGYTHLMGLSIATVIKALEEMIDKLQWESALEVFDLLYKQNGYKPDVALYVNLIAMLGKCGQPGKAYNLFSAMTSECFITDNEPYNALMFAYSRNGLLDRAFSLLRKMKNTPSCHPNLYTYGVLIKSCHAALNIEGLKALHVDMGSLGIRPDVFIYNTLIDAYGKTCRFEEMEATLSQMLNDHDCKPDVWTMNATLRAYGSVGKIEMMEICYEKFWNAGLRPNTHTFNTLLDSYGKVKCCRKMKAVIKCMQKCHISWTLVTYNVLIENFGRAGNLEEMEYTFGLMKSKGVGPDCVTFCSLVRAYDMAKAVNKINWVLGMIEISDVRLDAKLFNCLLHACRRSGCMTKLKTFLDTIDKK